MTPNKKKGLIVLLSPIIAVFAVLILFFITNLITTAIASDSAAAFGSIIAVILGYLGILAVLSAFVCVPLGIYSLLKKDSR